ncbi:MAG: glycerol-3-phosphate 1-O-acyltransferase PlsY [Bacteroidetes bacterium]|nr:glycerol-3-phosphate 1-O-acyltransferase PlsY [Bacteroidota bacterium]
MELNYILLITGGIVAYLLGSISFSVWIGRIFHGIDVREKGSGNAGATNTIRVLGLRTGIIVLLLDTFKAWFSVQLAPLFAHGSLEVFQLINYSIALGALAVLGHVFPLYTGFRGGKGVASLVGVVIALYPYAFLAVLLWFIFVFVLTRYVSLSSITSAVLFPFLVILIFHEKSLSLVILSVFIAVFIPVTHRKNIKRLLKGEELKMSFRKNQG